jgi:DNA-binding response OmpR family regulator
VSEIEKANILIIEDDVDIADMLNAYFRVQGYDVEVANWGEDGVKSVQTKIPDLVILDIRLPDIDGFEVAHRLRTSHRTKAVPIIFLTERRDRKARLQGLELAADDYITKPFDIQELRICVRNSLSRSKQGSLVNPVTALPEGVLVDEQLKASLTQRDCALLVISVKNLDYFREMYGFVASDDLLRATTLMLQDTLQEFETPDSFIGHLTSTDFLVILSERKVTQIRQRILKRLKQSFEYFYRDQDRGEGEDRFKGKELTIQSGQLILESEGITSLSQLKSALDKFYHQVSI